ncbi:uncharacterized protein BDR25DRAFT_261580 [Lindgomyces ingoldianus]|uniref:Uncharacterized protein n=1 Tax=Lindgomyces ingoldianus TaxID=673940 RepID=A0ACB6QUP6_9PLEO|nr:uncharacterized protein BDR25DRAFT_261580 [Lindgomyces ingoldianus]KAF2470561.1 hypothetical protein BDR25DRAFT_261580 [Lindgomyces ingoldianus]
MAYNHGPFMVIGVDFGMTCTGVAFSEAPRWTDPKTFQQWTSIISELANKVPSKLAYTKSNRELQAWGFYCPQDDPSLEIQELFKLNLDPDYMDPYENAPTTEQARGWYLDYLRCIHDHIAHHFMSRIPNWNSLQVEWNFSVPTTWKNPKVIVDIEVLIKMAGFGTAGPSHRTRVTLNEAEAAAIAVARQYLQFNDVLMVCDSGGGTSDVSILKVASHPGEATKLAPLLPVEGGWFGSALIDMAAQQLLMNRLSLIATHLQLSPQEAVQMMIGGRFERFKCSFGGEGTDIPTLPLPVPGLPPGSYFPEAGIVNSNIIITRDELQSMFDEQVHGIINLMDSQLRKLQQEQPLERVSFLVLSGGLGASPYLRKRIMSYFEYTAPSIRVLLAEQPQLAVAHGLVAERTQMVTQGVIAIRERPSRLSYGVVCDQIYQEENHLGEYVVRDPRDGKRWAKAQIEWIIKQGDKVPTEGVAKEFRAKIQRSQIGRPWKAQVVMSAYPPDQLPRSMYHEGVTTLCIVESSLLGVKMKVKNKHWWNSKKKHSMAEFDLKVIPGSADLTFQLWSENRMVSREQENLAIVWDDNLRPQAELAAELHHE